MDYHSLSFFYKVNILRVVFFYIIKGILNQALHYMLLFIVFITV